MDNNEWINKLKKMPSELKLSERWQSTFQQMGSYAAVGCVAGVGMSTVLFRGMILRAGMSALTTGFGAGRRGTMNN